MLVAALVAAAAGFGVSYAVRPSSPSRHGSDAAVATVHSLTWSSRELGSAAFSATACATAQHCFAFGLGGFFATSDDGGTSWSVSQRAGMSQLTVLATTCPSARRCVALAEKGDPSAYPPAAAQPAGVALVSDDGGRSWSPARVRGAAVQFLGGLACPSVKDCYATGVAADGTRPARGFLLVSSDGGIEWTTRRRGPAYGLGRALACPGVGRCFAVGGPRGIVATSDGGLRWTEESEPMGAGGIPGISALACSSLTTCAGVGSEPHPGYPVVVTTGDGGSSWRFAQLSYSAPSSSPAFGALVEDMAGGGFTAVSCAAPRCVAVAESIPEVGLLASSGDGGRTWQFSVLGGGGSFSGVTCAGGGCIAAGTVGEGSALLALGSRGRHWSKSYVGPATDMTSLSCPSTHHCVAAGVAAPVPVVGAVTESDDGGAHWSAGRLPAGPEAIVALDCPTTRHCLALADVAAPPKLAQQGNDVVAEILSSDDGGRSWRGDLVTAPPDTLDALSCPTASTCYAVGATLEANGVFPQDAIVTTDDGGARWIAEQVPAFPPQPPTGTSGSEILGGGLTSISCFGPRSCVAGGAAGVLATNDGATWAIRYQTPGPDNGGVVADGVLFGQLQLLACPTLSRCVGVISTADGVELELSVDGGRSWRSAASPTVTSVTSLTCPASSECLAAGSGSRGAIVLESFDGGRRWSAAPVPGLLEAAVDGVAAASYTTIACAAPRYCVALGAGAVGEVVVER